MAFKRPTLTELNERVVNDIETRVPASEPRLRRSLFNVLARVFSGVVHGLYGYLDYLSKQILPDTADDEYLVRHASIWGLIRKPAAPAIGNVTFTGNNGTVIPAGTLLQRSDSVEFATASEVIIAGGTALATVTAEVAGADGNTDAAIVLNLVSVIAGADSQATIDGSGLTSGSYQEDDTSLRQRVLSRIQQPPHGGALFDYQAWALEVSGVTRAWVSPLELGAGTVTVRFVRDDDVSIIPDLTEIEAVQDYIDNLRPVTADVTVVAPIAVELNLTIQLTPASSLVQAAVQAELKDLLRRESQPSGTILLSHLREAISIAAGETDHNLVSPSADVTHSTGEMATMGTITWL
tara:strand:- start:33360 stop:34412 length:1053 start_codon:yes stop_codon:yes gene_type:complete